MEAFKQKITALRAWIWTYYYTYFENKFIKIFLLPLLSIVAILPRILLFRYKVIHIPFRRYLRNFLVRAKIKIAYKGCRFIIGDWTDVNILNDFHEPYVWQLLNSLSEGDVFIDIGAHIGGYSIPLAKRGVYVIAVEPHPLNYYILRENASLNNLNNNIVLIKAAAWCCRTTLMLDEGVSSDLASVKHSRGIGGFKVPGIDMDSVISKLKLPKIDIIKIDVEEAEIEVLRGLRNTLRKYKPIIIIEVLNKNFQYVKDYLESMGYSIKILSKMGWGFYIVAEKNLKD